MEILDKETVEWTENAHHIVPNKLFTLVMSTTFHPVVDGMNGVYAHVRDELKDNVPVAQLVEH